MPVERRLARLSSHVRPVHWHVVPNGESTGATVSGLTKAAHYLGAASNGDAVPGERQLLTVDQIAFIDTFGYLVLPGLVSDKIADIVAAFSAVWDVDTATGLPRRAAVNTGTVHDDSTRSYIVPFIDNVLGRLRCVVSAGYALCWTILVSTGSSPHCSVTTTFTLGATGTIM